MVGLIVALLWALHLVSCVLLIIIVLLQSGRGHGVAGLFGGGAGESAFGVKTGTLLGKITGGIAAFFMVSSALLAVLSGRTSVAGTGAVDESDQPVNVEPGAPQPAQQPGGEPAKESAGQPDKPEAGAPEQPDKQTPPTGRAPFPEDVWLA